MKKILALSLLIFSIFVFACSQEMTRSFTKTGYSFSGKKKLALVNVYVQSKRDNLTVRRQVITEFELQLKQKGYSIIAQDAVTAALKELTLPIDREYTATEMEKLKEKLNAEILVQGYVSEEAESLISDTQNINFHFKYYDGSDGRFVAEALYQNKGSKTIIEAELVTRGIINVLSPLGIQK